MEEKKTEKKKTKNKKPRWITICSEKQSFWNTIRFI
jgi:hypothetical protein